MHATNWALVAFFVLAIGVLTPFVNASAGTPQSNRDTVVSILR